ncbi:hypothetical protein [Bowmanella denitrificans]|uniref:hypothetical protein n=1 Tax=Bowmanella denitrificans TaxID=366582 RepID=UPI000C9C3D80|nr:hypothetical protein [Bowmanella denitrificans]
MNQENPTLYYGLASHQEALNQATQVCSVFGHGVNGCAINLLMETASAETQLGQYPDTTPSNGFGLNQFDHVGFTDLQKRTRQQDKLLLSNIWGYNLDALFALDLADDPVLSMICCRLKYKLRPEIIPATLPARAKYWKRFYNTELGKGTEEHYTESANRLLYAPGAVMSGKWS